MLEYKLYTSIESNEEEIGKYSSLLETLKKKHSISYEIICLEELTESEKEELTESIRLISRKNGIGVVSKGSGALPISRNKKISKNGILIQLEDKKPRNVYPHEVNKKRIHIISHLEGMIKADNVNCATDQESISEQDISRIISTFPELIEEGLVFMDTEVEINGGRIDAVFKSKDDEHLLIEIEIEAQDNAIGQVQRFITYSEEYGVPRNKIRLGIVCAKIAESRLNACIGAGIEIYTLSLKKRA
ncbi:endonuclease NucS domain-containing protein [Methanolobus sp. ZRKC2]|uniref:endonuclease NucS domain-containing protein n=1 Tax=Methanolobus sp. ZRKC2 TaxID=3125783 RepID=UPI00324E1A7D